MATLISIAFDPPPLCSLEVVLRAEAVEMVQAGDKCDFTGTLIVVPDVSQLRTEGQELIKKMDVCNNEPYMLLSSSVSIHTPPPQVVLEPRRLHE